MARVAFSNPAAAMEAGKLLWASSKHNVQFAGHQSDHQRDSCNPMGLEAVPWLCIRALFFPVSGRRVPSRFSQFPPGEGIPGTGRCPSFIAQVLFPQCLRCTVMGEEILLSDSGIQAIEFGLDPCCSQTAEGLHLHIHHCPQFLLAMLTRGMKFQSGEEKSGICSRHQERGQRILGTLTSSRDGQALPSSLVSPSQKRRMYETPLRDSAMWLDFCCFVDLLGRLSTPHAKICSICRATLFSKKYRPQLILAFTATSFQQVSRCLLRMRHWRCTSSPGFAALLSI